jgi:nucleotide-binding universal stress UspA family protein
MVENREMLLLCIDLEPGSEVLAQSAVRFAHQCNLQVLVLHVCSYFVSADAQEQVQSRLQQFIERTMQNVPVYDAHVVMGKPEQAILQYASDKDIQCIILGKRKRTTVDRTHVRSTSYDVIAEARVPVLIIPVDGEG